ncbi:MAG: hypothetical protein CMJ78_13170 [Planctomycetaceae bacterium]|nr:hypothetical protein [Planctomycetaceae bacterium]
MAAAIKSKTGVEPKMIQGSGGIFDVILDGNKIFCKHDVNRFPEHSEVLEQL